MHSFTQAVAQWALPGIIIVSALGALVMSLLVLRYGFSSGERDRGLSRDAVLITRAGHAIAGTCFAIAALLAVVVLAQSARSAALPEPSAMPQVVGQGEVDALRQELAEAQAQLAQRLADAQAELARVQSRLEAGGADADAGRMRVEDLEARVRATETSLHRLSKDTARAVAATKQLSAVTPPRRPVAVAPPRSPATTPTPPRVAPPATTLSPPLAPPPSPPRAAAPPPQSIEAARPSSEIVRPAPHAAAVSRPSNRVPDTTPRATRSVAVEDRAGAPQPAPDPEPDIGTRLREDWELVKRESRLAGEQVRDAFRRLREALR